MPKVKKTTKEKSTDKKSLRKSARTDDGAENIEAAVIETPIDAYQKASSAELSVKMQQMEEKIIMLSADLESQRDKTLRIMAEYENFRKRTAKEVQQLRYTAGERIFLKLLPVLDDFDRLFKHNSENSGQEKIPEGVELIHKKLISITDVEGLNAIVAIGEDFNAEIHEAIAQVEDETKPNGVVVEELERGYRLGERIIRHSKVIVNNYKAQDVSVETEEQHTNE